MKKINKIFAKIISFALVFSFAMPAANSIVKSNTLISYAASAEELQRDELKAAVADAEYVRKTESYKNADLKDRKDYDRAIEEGKRVLANPNASGQELYNATKNIDILAKYLPTSANIKILKKSLEENKTIVNALKLLQKFSPNTVRKNQARYDSILKKSQDLAKRAETYIKNNQR